MWGCAADGSDSIDHFLATYGGTVRAALWAQCTAEHIVPQGEGGRTAADNIAAACRFCNQNRQFHRDGEPFREYRLYVVRQLAAGRWEGCAWWRVPDFMRAAEPDEAAPERLALPEVCGN